MKEYEGAVHVRAEDIDGNPEWYWVREDTGAWFGPLDDWRTSHRAAYLDNTPGRAVAVQAGGNCGMYPRLLSDHFQLVYTFEPDPLNFLCLTLNCQKDNIIKMQAALGDEHKMIVVNRAPIENVGMHQVTDGAGYGFIPQLRIDDLVLPACDLIQLDVELYEIFALRGALETINKFKPTIVVENNNEEIGDLLIPIGYQSVAVSKMDTVWRCQ